MPVTPTYPGVYIEEVPSAVRAITPVSTSITAFVGSATRGPTLKPTTIQSFSDFEKRFGGLDQSSTMSYAVYHYFLNGGAEAVIVRVAGGTKSSTTIGSVKFQANGEGIFGDGIKIRIDHATSDPKNRKDQFNLFVHDSGTGATETFRNVSVDNTDPRWVVSVVKESSQLIEFADKQPDFKGKIPPANANVPGGSNPFDPEQSSYYSSLKGGKDSDPVYKDDDVSDGIESLSRSFFNLLCIPPVNRSSDTSLSVYQGAVAKCVEKRAVLIVDSGDGVDKPESAKNQFKDFTELAMQQKEHAAFYFPRFKAPDPLRENRLDTFVPCGAVAGMIARTDVTRGVWKSPGGIEAGLTGADELLVELTDKEQGLLNPHGINCIRSFPVYGNVVWGVRTVAGDDAIASQWKYLAVRRTALFIEESLYRGTQWVVMEPNAKPTWDAIELNITNFMQRLFRQGAFQGETPEKSYLVKCDEETTTQADIDLGIVNILVGFAPLKPAEFVIIRIQQIVQTGE